MWKGHCARYCFQLTGMNFCCPRGWQNTNQKFSGVVLWWGSSLPKWSWWQKNNIDHYVLFLSPVKLSAPEICCWWEFLHVDRNYLFHMQTDHTIRIYITWEYKEKKPDLQHLSFLNEELCYTIRTCRANDLAILEHDIQQNLDFKLHQLRVAFKETYFPTLASYIG